MKFPSSTEVYLAMIPRRSSLVSCFGSGSEAMILLMIAIVWPSSDATRCSGKHWVSTVSPRWSGGIVVMNPVEPAGRMTVRLPRGQKRGSATDRLSLGPADDRAAHLELVPLRFGVACP